jgi:HD-like signal output (HDOD) protein
LKRILFVDDEPNVLDGVRTRLHRRRATWEMTFLPSGQAALEKMQERPYDVIVTDMRMPGMNGDDLLQTVSTRWPQTIRIVFSGYSELQQTIRLVPFAHQYLSKPCQPQQLENLIDRCLSLHGLLNEPKLRSIVGRLRSLPTPPKIYLALQNIVKDECVSLAEVAALVTSDAALAARVLQIVNSAFFRLAKRISSIEHAVSYLGFAAIRNIAASVEIFTRWPGGAGAGVDLEKLQEHVHDVAAAANCLAAGTSIRDDVLLAALLHDIGYWILAQECPADLRRAVDLAVAERVPLHVAEKNVIGASHSEIGAYLLGIWGLPYSVVEAVAHHHQPQTVQQTEFDVLAALVAGHSLAHADDASAFGNNIPPDPQVDPAYLTSTNAPFTWEEAVERVSQINSPDEVSA